MQRAIGNTTRSRILRTPMHNGDLSAKELGDALDLQANNLHYHLGKLVNVDLVQNLKRNEPDRSGLYSYYRATALGEGILDHGLKELMRREHEFSELYT